MDLKLDTAATLAWAKWRAEREISARAPHGPLSLAGTYWLDEGATVPGVPGRWRVGADGATVTASATEQLLVDGTLASGVRPLRPDTDTAPSAITHAGRKLLLIEREGAFALRVFDPDAPERGTFAGIAAFGYSPRWRLAASFHPYAGGEREVRVPHADGRERGIPLAGEVTFWVDGEPHTLAVGRWEQGLEAVFSDTSEGTYRFRFLDLPAPDADGNTLADFNRAYLPPCAFSEHYLCPFPPPGNSLRFAVDAGERQVLRHAPVPAAAVSGWPLYPGESLPLREPWRTESP
jgi:uncharacterized protein